MLISNFKAEGFDAILSAPKEELHQLLIGLYGEHLLPVTMYEIEKTLRNPNTIRGFDKMALKYIYNLEAACEECFFSS